jgi:Permease MlaE
MVNSSWGLVSGSLEWFGDLGIFFWQVVRVAVTPPLEFRELFRQVDEIGSKSLPLLALAGAATGVVLSLEARYSLTRFGAKSLLPAAIVFSVIHETGLIITGPLISREARPGDAFSLARLGLATGSGCFEGKGEEKYVSHNLVPSDWADRGVFREIGDARTHDDLLDDRARHHRIDPGRGRGPHVFAPDQRTLSSCRPHFFHTGRDTASLHLLQAEDSFARGQPVLT